MKYRFKRLHLNFNPGDPVPETYSPGVVDALLMRGLIGPVTSAEPAKAIAAPPANKSFANRGKIKNK